jgi:alpha-D-xyloside xylohydrolase
MLALVSMGSVTVLAQSSSLILDRDGRTIVLEPYAPNIVRVTFSKTRAKATAAPGYGFVGTPSMTGWSHERDADGNDVFRSGRLVVHLSPDHLTESLLPHPMPLDDLNQALRTHYFGGGNRKGPNDDTLSVTTTSGQVLLTMRNWSMRPNPPEAAAPNAEKTALDAEKQDDPGYRVSATFDSPTGEHYYGLGQQQQGALDLRDHQVKCWHDYSAIG